MSFLGRSTKHFQLIAEGVNVWPLLAEIEAHPELWDQYGARRAEGSPHYGIPDIWVRWRKLSELTSPEKYNEPHFAEFYPAWNTLPSLQPIVFDLMALTRAVYLGGILITKIPAGKSVLPHNDRGGWHAEFMNMKVYIPLKTNEGCFNYCEDEPVAMKIGEAWSFNNLLEHGVENNGQTDRLTLIICTRVEC